MTTDQAITGWATSTVKSKRAAAMLAARLAAQEPGTLVPSTAKLATELGVRQPTAQRARNLLLGAGIVYKHGTHLYVSGRQARWPEAS